MKDYEIRVDVTAAIHWLTPPADIAEQIRRELPNKTLSRMAFELRPAVEKMLMAKIEDERARYAVTVNGVSAKVTP